MTFINRRILKSLEDRPQTVTAIYDTDHQAMQAAQKFAKANIVQRQGKRLHVTPRESQQ